MQCAGQQYCECAPCTCVVSCGALVGAIFGTGTNGAYIESGSTIKKFKAVSKAVNHTTVNTKWSGFEDDRKALPATIFDNKVDRESIRPRNHIYERSISRMYMGEETSIVSVHLIDQLVLFDVDSPTSTNTHYGFDTALMSPIEADEDAAD